jgi:hypothetical protein
MYKWNNWIKTKNNWKKSIKPKAGCLIKLTILKTHWLGRKR